MNHLHRQPSVIFLKRSHKLLFTETGLCPALTAILLRRGDTGMNRNHTPMTTFWGWVHLQVLDKKKKKKSSVLFLRSVPSAFRINVCLRHLYVDPWCSGAETAQQWKQVTVKTLADAAWLTQMTQGLQLEQKISSSGCGEATTTYKADRKTDELQGQRKVKSARWLLTCLKHRTQFPKYWAYTYIF